MDPGTAALWAVAVSIVGLAFVLLFKSPKEVSREIEVRVGTLEERHHELDTGFYEFRATVLAELRHLTDAINRLSTVLGQEKITQSGEHRVVKRRGE